MNVGSSDLLIIRPRREEGRGKARPNTSILRCFFHRHQLGYDASCTHHDPDYTCFDEEKFHVEHNVIDFEMIVRAYANEVNLQLL